MVFQENDGGVDDEKEIIHAKRWYVYIKEKKTLIKGLYSVKVSGYDSNKVLW